MKIAIIGAGNVGGALGVRLAKKHAVTFGVRNPKDEKYEKLKDNIKAKFEKPAEAVKSAEIVILATPWSETKKAIEECGSLAGKIVIDATNPIKKDFTG